MRKILLICLVLAVAFPSVAQTRKEKREAKQKRISALIKTEEEGVIAYSKHTLGGIKLLTDGYGGFFEIGRAKSLKKMRLYQFEFAERKHPKEQKQTNGNYADASPFIYGKQNFFYNVKLGFQEQILLGNKGNKNGVSVSGNYGGGITLGLLRPYYVQINDGVKFKFIKYDSPDSIYFLNPNSIVGGPSFSQGWGDISVTPGLYGKAAVRFDYGRYNEMINAIEVGVAAEFYTKQMAQIVYVEQKQFFVAAYVSILFGGRK